MTVLHVVDELSKTSGVAVFCAEIAQRLSSCGIHVVIAVRTDLKEEGLKVDSSVRIVLIDDVLSGSIKYDWDVVHIHAFWQYFLHRVQNWACKNKIPVVLSPHGAVQPWALKSKWYKKIPALVVWQYRDMLSSSAIHACSESECRSVHRILPGKNLILEPLGAECRWTTDELKAMKSTRAKDRRTILFLSRIHPSKGLFNLVDAWGKLKKMNPELAGKWRIRVVGRDYADHLKDVQARAISRGCDGDIEFVGPRFDDEKDREYAMADVFVSPTYSENFGAVVLESLACCTPVIITKGAPWKRIEDRKCGRWIDIGVEPLCRALLEMMQKTDEERWRMGCLGYDMVKREYSWATIAQRLIVKYEQVVREA